MAEQERGSKWSPEEVREFLTLRADEKVNSQLEGTVRDAVIYGRIADMMSERGYSCTKKQVISKLKALKLAYHKIRDHNSRSGKCGTLICAVKFGGTDPVQIQST
ncbi:UNVERIFIED_CONTAM: hypothetical protein FKN15_040674 [Acipenser sinensis]